MPHIKKLVMQGFKSFASRTEVPLERHLNVVVGPNGVGKSNISDGICFVLGRLSIKSMRADKSAGLIFKGTKTHKPANEASVEIVFDNSDKIFFFPGDEVRIKRTVRRTGQSSYYINNQVKTRQEVLELLAQAGIDPNGFNIILQGEIDSLARMRPEDRRKIIEEVAGISVYEIRKEKSLRELEKTDEKLKEISTVLRERTAYLKNLDKERQQALRYKHFENLVKKCKASIIKKELDQKKKESDKIFSDIEKKQKSRSSINSNIEKLQHEINQIEMRENEINAKIQKATGIEQEKLHNEIADLRAELAGLTVRKENFENRLIEIRKRKQELEKNISEYESELKELRKKFPAIDKKQQDLEKKRKELAILEEKRKKLYTIKTEISLIKERITEKKFTLDNLNNESRKLLEEIEKLSSKLDLSENLESLKEKIQKLSKNKTEKQEISEKLEFDLVNYEKKISSFETEINSLEKVKKQVSELDICPLCKSKMTKEHVKHVIENSNKKILILSSELNKNGKEIEQAKKLKEKIKKDINFLDNEIETLSQLTIKFYIIDDKKSKLRSLVQEQNSLKAGVSELEKRRIEKSRLLADSKIIEEQYDNTRLALEEISARTEESLGTEIDYKERELERIRAIVKRLALDDKEVQDEISEIENSLDEKSSLLEEKESTEKKMNQKFQKLFQERTDLQKQIKEQENKLFELQQNSRKIEDEINNLKIEKARVDAALETLEVDFKAYKDVEILKGSKEILQEKLQKAENILNSIGSVNLRALEVYEEVKKEYDVVNEKTEQLEKEKIEILKIIDEIDKKKKKTLLNTLEAINYLFTRNFSQLSTKGQAYLELENKEDPFAAGIDIIVKVAKGKYFDVANLSGGEKTLVALSLIFAIQEYRPYCFYILDEVDAALDKRNSERLAILIKKYMKTGQYLITTHNDAIISESGMLYGISMHEGISKILSLQV